MQFASLEHQQLLERTPGESFVDPSKMDTPAANHARLLQETRDAGWAEHSETLLKNVFATSPLVAGVDSVLIACATTICEIQWSDSSSRGNLNKIEDAIRAQDWYGNALVDISSASQARHGQAEIGVTYVRRARGILPFPSD